MGLEHAARAALQAACPRRREPSSPSIFLAAASASDPGGVAGPSRASAPALPLHHHVTGPPQLLHPAAASTLIRILDAIDPAAVGARPADSPRRPPFTLIRIYTRSICKVREPSIRLRFTMVYTISIPFQAPMSNGQAEWLRQELALTFHSEPVLDPDFPYAFGSLDRFSGLYLIGARTIAGHLSAAPTRSHPPSRSPVGEPARSG